ncbi:hypothetical protein [Rummeliibacillus stabekisii]|uniref:Uncharacterized protein n=1 Tax=Rummeliibacillus stabekisii TaxID=241244 RepID=A0A143HC38_9BACL|nr:hypothetical protein [Rummeliibacillus stabekisii]AMW99318.1 hypothetical protein ATY39_07485 [Rummeliibacillus stabekisii]
MEGIKETENGRVIISSKRLCSLLDITDKTLTNWARDGLEKESRGWWDLQKVLAWRGLTNDSATPGEKKAKTLMQKKLEAEVAYKEAQVELTQFKNALANGEYVERDVVQSELSRFFIVFKKSTLGLSKNLAGIVAGYVDNTEARRVERDLNDIILEALDQMSVEGVYSARKKKK